MLYSCTHMATVGAKGLILCLGILLLCNIGLIWPLQHAALLATYGLYIHAISHLCLHLFSCSRLMSFSSVIGVVHYVFNEFEVFMLSDIEQS